MCHEIPRGYRLLYATIVVFALVFNLNPFNRKLGIERSVRLYLFKGQYIQRIQSFELIQVSTLVLRFLPKFDIEIPKVMQKMQFVEG